MSAPPAVLADRYELGAVVGSGSTAVVHRSWDRVRGVPVAVKLFHADHDPRRHRDEMAALARLRHPGLVALHGGDIEGSVAFVVLDLVDGPTLAQRILLDGPLPVAEVRRLGCHVADALAHVHAAGIVHRDVKPANVLLDGDGNPRLTDFGIARAFEAATLTRAGAVIGTAAFLAPEQVRGRDVGPAADVYALGLVLLEALTGRREYPGPAAESATARLHRAPAVPRHVPADLARLVRSMTARDPVRRPGADAVAAALHAGPGTAQLPVWHRVRPGRPVLVAAVLVAGVVVGAVLRDVALPGTVVPGTVVPGTVVPGTVVPAAPATAAIVPADGTEGARPAPEPLTSRMPQPVAPAMPEPVAEGPAAPPPRSVAPQGSAPVVMGGGPVRRTALPGVPADGRGETGR